MSTTLPDLPLELVEQIISFADPISVSAFSQTCRMYFELVYDPEAQHLWRNLFLAEECFDDPRRCVTSFGEPLLAPDAQFDWRGELKRRTRAQTVITNPTCARDNEELLGVLSTLIRMATQTPTSSYRYASDEISRNLVCLVSCRALGNFIEYLEAQRTELSHELRQLVAQLHTLTGLTGPDFSEERRVKSRSFMYDMENYTAENGWGPFKSTGEVNWEHLLAVQHIMAMHVVAPTDSSPQGNQVLSLLPYCQAQLPEQENKEDWAGVEGLWSCSFCFIDHRILIAYNENHTRDPSFFTDAEFVEVFRSFPIRIRFIGTKPNPKHPSRPTIMFMGGVQEAHTMSGTVRVADDGTVRWRFTSGEAQQMVWSTEGVQIGVAQSTFGVLGTWTTIFHDDQDPIGPFWLRKELDSGLELLEIQG